MVTLALWIKRSIYLLLCLAIYSSIRTTFVVSSDFHGLLLNMYISDDRSMNPFSPDFSWINSDVAEYLVLNRQFPYENCGQFTAILVGCGASKVSSVGSFMGLSNTDSDDKYYRVLDHLLARGEFIDGRGIAGYTALHGAILSRDKELITYLLNNGSDPNIKSLPSFDVPGRNAFDFIEVINRNKDPEGLAVKSVFERGLDLRISNEVLEQQND